MTKPVFRLLTAATALLALLFLAPGPASAASEPEGGAQTARLTPADEETVARVERYLSGVDTLHARFRQVSSNGATAQGELWVDRPGKLRFEYDPPHPALLVSNGTLLLYYDRELEQTSYVPVSETPLWFLVRERIDIRKAEDYALAAVTRSDDRIRLQVVPDGSQPGDPGSVTLVFRADPLALASWRIVDQQGITTEVTLLDPEAGVAVDAERFDFGALDLPRPRTQPRR